MTYEDAYQVNESCDVALLNLSQEYMTTPNMQLLVSVENVSVDYINQITDAFAESKCKKKAIEHSVCVLFKGGIARTFLLNGKNTLTKRTVHREIQIDVQNRPYALCFTLYRQERIMRKMPYLTMDNVTRVKLFEQNRFTFGNWEYKTIKVLEGPTKKIAAGSLPRYNIELSVPSSNPDIHGLRADKLKTLFLNRGLDLLGRFSHQRHSSNVSLSTNDTTHG